jgi:citrate synthase
MSNAVAEPTKAVGLEGIVVANTQKSKVDGIAGRLIYCGYEIDDLARNASFEEVVFLLWNNRLPLADELAALDRDLKAARGLPEPVSAFIAAMPAEAVPMAVLRTVVSLLACYDPEAELETEEARQRVALRLVAQIPTIIAAFERRRNGLAAVAPRNDLSHAANFLYMMNGAEPGPAAVRAIDAYLVLLADHGFNASTFSARVTSATLSDLYSAITSAIGTLKGSLHGGANQRVMEMLERIGSPEAAEAWVMQAIENKERIMGIGHRVYKTLDPRAKILREMSREIAAETGSKYHAIGAKVADTAVAWFEANRPDLMLYPNVDFYSAGVLEAAGVPTDQFTPLFAMSRVAGWTAHVLEQYQDNRLIRPRGQYVGPLDQVWKPIAQRG